jgi:hypothetical protein
VSNSFTWDGERFFFSNITSKRASDVVNLSKSASSKIKNVSNEALKHLLPDAASEALSNVILYGI